MSFSPAVGLLVEYKGSVGEIRFIDEQYLTICLKRKCESMISDVCVVVYPAEWDQIKLIEGGRGR